MKVPFLLAVSLLLCSCSPSGAQNDLVFEDSWVRVIPPGSMMTAGFGLLRNEGKTDLEIIAYSSPDFADISLHQTVMEEGVSKMKAVPELTLKAGSELLLEPGSYHLMFMQPLQSQGDVLLLHVDVADGQRFSFELPVERR